MKALEITITVLLWILAATILWALWPWLVKFWVLAAKVHAMGLQ